MKREDVEALLAVSVAGNDEWADVVQRKLTRRITRELCRAWLDLEGAEVAEAAWDGGADVYLIFDGGPEELRGCKWNACMGEQLHGKRVRIVPVEGEGE